MTFTRPALLSAMLQMARSNTVLSARPCTDYKVCARYPRCHIKHLSFIVLQQHMRLPAQVLLLSPRQWLTTYYI